jgi:hypothetical protein
LALFRRELIHRIPNRLHRFQSQQGLIGWSGGPVAVPRHAAQDLIADTLAAAIGHCLVVGHAEEPRLARLLPRFMPPLGHFHERRLEHVGSKLGISQDSQQKPPQLLPVLHVQGRHDRRVEQAPIFTLARIGG